MKVIGFFLLIITAVPQFVFAQNYYYQDYHGNLNNQYGYYQYQGNPTNGVIYPMGVQGNIGSPNPTGIPGNSGVVPGPGAVPELTPKTLTPRKLDTHLLIQQSGAGDQCQAGVTAPATWELNFSDPMLTKDDLIGVIRTATEKDTRLREVRILDDEINMYYLQPAYVWGFIPTNYLLRVQASSNSLRMSLEKPKWVTGAKNFHNKATEAFSTYVPQYLSDQRVKNMEGEELIMRDAEMIQIISGIMSHVDVAPISNSFFACYVMPFLLYILFFIVALGLLVWYIVRRIRRGSGLLVKKIHPVELGGSDRFETEYTGDEHVTHFKLPEK